MQIGRRIIYNKESGEIIAEMAEMDCEGLSDRPNPSQIDYIDIPYGEDKEKFSRVKAYRVDVATKTIVFDEFHDITLTPDQQQIAELQQQLLQAQEVI